LVAIVGLSSLLIQPLQRQLGDLYVKNRVVRLIVKLAHTRPDIVSGKVKLDSINVTHRDGYLHVNIEGFFPIDKDHDTEVESYEHRVDMFREHLSNDIGTPVIMTIDAIPVNMVHFQSLPPELQAE
jgi:hypothetical protein